MSRKNGDYPDTLPCETSATFPLHEPGPGQAAIIPKIHGPEDFMQLLPGAMQTLSTYCTLNKFHRGPHVFETRWLRRQEIEQS